MRVKPSFYFLKMENDLKSGKLVKYVQMIGGLAVVVLILLVIIGGFGKQVRTETVTDAAISDFNVSDVGTQISLGSSYPYPQSISGCLNATGSETFPSSYATIAEGSASGGTFTLNSAGSDWANFTINCSLTYLADSDGSEAGDTFITGMTIFATFVGVIILALIGLVIVKLYKKED